MTRKATARASLKGIGFLSGVNTGESVTAINEAISRHSSSQVRLAQPNPSGALDFVDMNVVTPIIRRESEESVHSPIEFVPGRVFEVALAMLTEDPLNAREFYSVEELDDMGQSLVKHGQHAAISAYEREGRLWVFDGVKRLKAARSAGIGTLRVEIAPPPASEIDVYLTSRRMNLERSTQTAIDDAIRWQELLNRQIVANQQALASMVERSESYVSQVLSINRIPRSVLGHMKERPGTTEQLIAYKISGIFKPEHINAHGEEELVLMAKSMIDEISTKGLNRSEVDRLIERRLGAPRARAKSDHQKLRCFGKEGLLKLFPSKGKVEFSISGLNAEQLDKVQERIRALSQIDQVT